MASEREKEEEVNDTSDSDVSTITFILDSGASDHVVNNTSIMGQKRKVNKPTRTIVCANGEK